MSAPSSSRWGRGAAGRRASSVSPQLRVSDAERADVADRLSKHYSDGRLDQAEFDERLDQAMKAKTQSDLHGLFTDLPAAEEPGKPVRQRSRRRGPRIAGLVLIILIAAILGHALAGAFIPFFFWHALTGSFFTWLLIGLLVFLWLRYGPRHRDRS
jgi:Domain of unknown function (DUF1707)